MFSCVKASVSRNGNRGALPQRPGAGTATYSVQWAVNNSTEARKMAQRRMSRQETTRTFVTEADYSSAPSHARYDKVAIRGFSQSIGVISDGDRHLVKGKLPCVCSVAVSPDGKHLATASDDGLRVWRMEPNEELSLEWGSCTELSVEDPLVDDDGSLRDVKKKGRRTMMLETVAFGGCGDDCWIFGTREKLEGIKAWKLEVTATTSRISFEHIMCSHTDKKDGKFQLMSNLKGAKAPREPMAGGALVATKQYLVAGAKDGCVYVWDISRLRSRDGGRCDVAASFVLRMTTSFTFDPISGEFPVQYLAAGTKTIPVVAEVAHKCHKLIEMRRDIFVRSIEKKDILATLIDASTERGGTLLQISPLKRTFTKNLKVEELEIVHSGHTSKVNEVTCKGNRIASASNEPGKGTVIVWDIDPTEVVKSGTEGGLKATAAKKDKTEVDWHRFLGMYESDECISSLAFTSDSNRILVGGSSIVIFELVTVRRNSHFSVLFDRIQTLRGWSNIQQELGTYRTIALSNDDAVLISGSSDLTLRVWDLATGACRRTMTRPQYKRQKKNTDAADSFVGIPAAVASPDGTCVAFGGNGHLMVSIACDNVITVKNKWPTWSPFLAGDQSGTRADFWNIDVFEGE